MLKKILFIVIANLIFPLFAAAAKADIINNFQDLENALQNSPANLEINADYILFENNIFEQPPKAVDFTFKSISPSGTSVFDGGSVYAGIAVKNHSRISFENIILRSMSSQNGGALYVENSSGAFSGISSFENNFAYSGGALSALNSTLLFEAEVNFSSNYAANMGGALEINSSLVSFSSNVNITSNSALYSGGGFIAFNNAAIVFDSAVNISANSSLNGGGFMIDGSTAHFTANSSAVLSNNKAAQSGGAVDLRNSRVYFDGVSEFLNNSAFENGGAFCATEKSSIVFSTNALFSGNEASLGGAVYINDSNVFFTNTNFYSNSAEIEGGAIYAEGGYVSVYALSGGKSVFQNNKAAGVSNAITLKDGATAFFYADAGSSIEMRDGINSSKDSIINFGGEGNFNLYAALPENEASLTISFSDGGAFNVKDGGGFRAQILTNGAGSKINLTNSKSDAVLIKELNNYGTIALDASSGALDAIRAEGGVNLNSATSRLEASTDLSDANFRKITYKLINYGAEVNGSFAGIDVISAVSFSSSPVVNYGDVFENWITISIYGDKDQTSFSGMQNLGFNRYETAKTFDAVSQNAKGDMDAVISLIEGFDDNGIRKALLESSGYFLANALRSAAVETSRTVLFSRINSNTAAVKENNKLWIEYQNGSAEFYSDEESPRNYNDSSNALNAGYDVWLENDIIGGIYAKHSSHFIQQGGNCADISNAAIGFYGGYVKSDWQIKAALSGSFDNYETQRRIEFADRTAKADFGGSSLGADVEGSYKINIGRETLAKPFIGLTLKNTSYRSFTESGAQSLDLSVMRGSYFRSDLRLGAEIAQESSFFEWYLKGQAAALLSGKYPEIESSFDGGEISFASRGSGEPDFSFGVAAGAGVSFSKSFKFFAATDFNASSKSSFFNIILGLSYGFYSNAIN